MGKRVGGWLVGIPLDLMLRTKKNNKIFLKPNQDYCLFS